MTNVLLWLSRKSQALPRARDGPNEKAAAGARHPATAHRTVEPPNQTAIWSLEDRSPAGKPSLTGAALAVVLVRNARALAGARMSDGDRRISALAAWERRRKREESRRVWEALQTDLRAGCMLLAIARAAGCEFWFSSPTQIEIDIPPALPEHLRSAPSLYVVLNGKALGKLLDEEGV
jgi:hypothetical protein